MKAVAVGGPIKEIVKSCFVFKDPLVSSVSVKMGVSSSFFIKSDEGRELRDGD